MQFWVLLESQPHIRQYCERPATAIIDGKEQVIDFWARLDDQEQWIIVGNEDDSVLPMERVKRSKSLTGGPHVFPVGQPQTDCFSQTFTYPFV